MPCGLVVKKESKACSSTSGGMPLPLSSTATSTMPSTRRAVRIARRVGRWPLRLIASILLRVRLRMI